MTKRKFDVLVVGELNVDLILNQLEKLPEMGKEIVANKMVLTLGSSSAIFASNLAVLRTSVSFCGRVGRDSFANKVLADLTLKNVDINNIKRSNTADTGLTVVFNFKEERAMVTYPGAMNELEESHVTDTMLQSAAHLHVSSVFLQPALKAGLVRLFSRAKQFGLTTSLDPQWDPAEKWDCDWKNLLKLTDVFLPNIEELRHITNQQSVEDCVDVIKEVANTIVIKNGKEGAVIYTGKEVIHQPSFLNTQVADAIGAGDSFNAGFIHKFVQDKTTAECAEFGALCGAINTTRSGGTTAFADIDTVKRIALQKFNYHLHDNERQTDKVY
ncbi:PfkB family carbohydrate kinase [soil metagenome]